MQKSSAKSILTIVFAALMISFLVDRYLVRDPVDDDVPMRAVVSPADKTKAIQLKEKGNTYLDVKNYPEAIKHYRQAVQVDPGLGAAYYDLALAYGHMGDKENSTEYAYKALKLGYKEAKTYYNMGYFSASWGDDDKAIQYYEEAYQREPHSYAIILNLSLEYKKVGRLQDAARLAKAGLKLHPHDPALRRTASNIQLDAQESAHDAFKLSYYLDQCEAKVATACERAGYIHMAEEKADKALPLFKMACLGGQGLSCAQGGYLAYKANKRALATTLYGKGCELKNPDACTDLGDLAWQDQDRKKAFMLYLTGCELGGARACGLVGDTAASVSPKLAQGWYRMSCHLGNKIGCQRATENTAKGSSDHK